MILALVMGKAVSDHKQKVFEKRSVLLCQPLTLEGKPTGPPLLAMDTVGAGEGEVVLVRKEGRGAREFTGDPSAATRTLIVAIVDEVNLEPSWFPSTGSG